MLIQLERKVVSCFSVAALAAVWVVGCRGENRVAVNPVRGQVLYNGRGVPNATVIFYPLGDAADKLKKMRPYAYADANGCFELKTFVTGDGAPTGEYEVGIITTAGSDRDSAPSPQASSAVLPRELVQKYANQTTSGIKVTVEPGVNELDPFVLN
jgi:hypothetical protein